MSDNIFTNQFKFVKGQTSPEDALSAADYPASGSYIDVSEASRVICIVHFGVVHASDTPTLKLQSATAANGTLTDIDTTNCQHDVAADDDDEFVVFILDPAQLADGHASAGVPPTSRQVCGDKEEQTPELC